MRVQTPHDKFFKETFGKVEVAKDFLNNYLPENVMNLIDINTLEPQKDSFIDKDLKDFPKDVQKYIPDFEYLLYDLSKFTDAEIKGKVINKIAMTTLRDIFTKDDDGIMESLYKTLIYFAEIENQQTGIEYFETLMQYIFSAKADLTKKAVNEMLNEIETTYPEGSVIVMTLAEKFREEGMEKGLALGETNSLIKTNIRLLTKKFGALPEDVKSGISKLDVDTLELITIEIFEYESLDDIKKYL